MKNNLLAKLLCATLVFMTCSLQANAAWEQIYKLNAPYCMHIAPNGDILVADYLFNEQGGIYYSEDGGTTWNKSDAPDYTYGKIIDAGEYLIATGKACRVARSNDNGRTWEVTNYIGAVSDIYNETSAQRTICYAAAMHNDRLYVGDFAGAGVLYTEDFGETWHRTHLESLQFAVEGRDGRVAMVTDNIYNLVSYKGELYAFGMSFVFKYDEANDIWITMRNDSNCLSQSTIYKDKLTCGRAIENESTDVPFILTFDGENWDEIARPAGFNDNNIRCMDADEKALYVGFQTSGFACTFDEGNSWIFATEGLPARAGGFADEYQCLVDLAGNDEYLYTVVYVDPFIDSDIDGVYRIAKSELEEKCLSVSDIELAAANIHCDGTYLYVGECTSVLITDLSGRTVDAPVVNGKVEVKSLATGVYVYKVVNNNRVVSGKFIK